MDAVGGILFPPPPHSHRSPGADIAAFAGGLSGFLPLVLLVFLLLLLAVGCERTEVDIGNDKYWIRMYV